MSAEEPHKRVNDTSEILVILKSLIGVDSPSEVANIEY